MGYDLTNNRGEEFRFSPPGWSLALEVAERAGWKPQGTQRPPDYPAEKEWTGDYFTNDGQRVSPSDATALIQALEPALADPQFAVKTKDAFDFLQGEMAKRYPRFKPIDYSLAEAAEFGQRLRSLIALARDGGFVIR
jgi:hypothetical protein